jgi:predicted ATPase
MIHINKITYKIDQYPVDDQYPFNLEIFRKTDSLHFNKKVTFFIGENGSGKSTLLQAICRKCNIHIWQDEERIRFGSNQYEGDFYKYIDVHWNSDHVPGTFFGAQIFNDFARFLDGWARATPAILDYFGGNSLLSQSHGQSLISFFQSVYKVRGIHFLDEPETALSPKNQLLLLKLLHTMSQDGHAQFIIATHSPILLALPDASIKSLDLIPIKDIKYEETEYYRIYKDFLNNKAKYIQNL